MAADDHAAVLKVWSKRHRDLARNRNQVVCQAPRRALRADPGGHPKQLFAARAGRILERADLSGAVALTRAELAAESSSLTCAASMPSCGTPAAKWTRSARLCGARCLSDKARGSSCPVLGTGGRSRRQFFGSSRTGWVLCASRALH